MRLQDSVQLASFCSAMRSRLAGPVGSPNPSDGGLSFAAVPEGPFRVNVASTRVSASPLHWLTVPTDAPPAAIPSKVQPFHYRNHLSQFNGNCLFSTTLWGSDLRKVIGARRAHLSLLGSGYAA